MKKTVTTIFSLLFGSLLLYSCETCDNPVITIPTEADNSWLAYKEKDKPEFETETGVVVKSFKFMGYYGQNVAAEGVSPSEECMERLDTQVFAQVADTTKRYPPMYTYILKRPDTLEVKVAIENRGEWSIDKDNPTYATLDVNGHPYVNVYEINADSVRTNSVKQILFNKDFGFLYVEFYDGKFLKLKR